MNGIDLDFESPGFIADPYPAYHQLRARAPVHRCAQGDWYLSRYEDALSLLKDGRFGRGSGGASPLTREQRASGALEDLISKWMVFRDGKAHARMRKGLSGAFTPRMVEGMRSRIQGITDELLDRVEGRGAMEVVADLAYPLPIMVISELLGLPQADRKLFREWANQITMALDRGDAGDMEKAAPAAAGMQQYFGSLIDPRSSDGGGAATLLPGCEAGVLPEERLATAIFLLWAGHETTKNLIASGLLTLLRNPDQLARLRQRPELIAGAVEECLRYESPLQKIGRWTLEEVRLAGSAIPKGEFVVALIGAANRDPERFADPDRFDVERQGGGHMAFGAGAHHCLGAPLARLEAQIAIGTAIRRLPRLTLAPGEPAWRPYTAFRSLEALPVTC